MTTSPLINLPRADRETLSALMDGEVTGVELTQALQACADKPELLDAWREFQLVGDVLRSPGLVGSHQPGFLSKLQSRLDETAIEPLLEQPAMPQPDWPKLVPAGQTSAPASRSYGELPANDASFRWKLAAAVASVLAVTALIWNPASELRATTGPQLVQAVPPESNSGQIIVASPQGAMLRDARLEELLAAHRHFGGTSALQTPSGFLRNATFEASNGGGR